MARPTPRTVARLSFQNGCVDLAPMPGTTDVVVPDEAGGVQRISPDGGLQPVLPA